MNRVLIQGGRVIDPVSGLNTTADVVIIDRKIARVSPTPIREDFDDADRIDAAGCIVAPGLIDVHVHFREPDRHHEETIASGGASALNGGFTTVCCMPNTRPSLDSVDVVQHIHERAIARAGPRVYSVCCATVGRAGKELTDFAALTDAGSVAFSDDGDCVADDDVMQRVLRASREVDRPFMQHCQDPAATERASMNAGALAEKLGQTGWPREAESSIIERDIRLNRDVGADYHVQHISCAESVELVRAARERGEPVTAEASPHHLLLTEDACAGLDTNAKMNPPLRTQRDVDALVEGVADGTITVLATDHAPHPPEKKQTSFAYAAFGIVGLDCALPLYARALIESGAIDWPRLIAMMTCNGATLVRKDEAGLGRLEEGGPADVTIIDPNLEWVIDPDEFAGTGRNCPFGGWNVRGRSIVTIVGGHIRHVLPSISNERVESRIVSHDRT